MPRIVSNTRRTANSSRVYLAWRGLLAPRKTGSIVFAPNKSGGRIVAENEPKRHHYVPQFYLRRFACSDDHNKVRVLERHRDIVVSDRKSIDRIGYEEGLHDYDDDGEHT